ncbi:MAG: alpha/beta fold hydrolase [Chlorobi bacterium]|nr:alpha/beta fold hydrolase [Chlorobiota bacterium]
MQEITDFHFRTVGFRSNPGLVLLHGFLGSSEEWLPVSEVLEKSFYCMIPDLPGHGKTPAANASFECQMDALARAIEQLQPAPSFLAGYSMGGRMALFLALRYPHLFRKAVIVSASPGLVSAEERRLRRENDERIARQIEKDFNAFLSRWYDLPLFSELKRHPSFEAVLSARKKNRPEQLALALRTLGTGKQPSLWDELKTCRHSLAVFAGEKDGKYLEGISIYSKATYLS